MRDPIPVSSGEWSWWPLVVLIGLAIFFAVAGVVKKRLEERPWWHTLLVAIATLVSSTVLTARQRDSEFLSFVFFAIPCFTGVALLYLALFGTKRG
jgi:uncharacterized membrane protein YhaH (DUF805 family)